MPSPDVSFYAILPTPFDSEGRVDEGAVRANVEQVATHGIRGVLLTGSYGEFQTLDDDERVLVTRCVSESGAMASIMSGAAAVRAAAAETLGRRLFDAGAHQVMVSAPFAAELTDDDLLVHFDQLADALAHDLVIYNNPVFGVDLSPVLLERVAVHDAVVAVKQGTKMLASMVDSIARLERPDGARVLAAADFTCAAAVGVGASGVTSTNVWVFPEAFLALADPGVDGVAKRSILSALRPYANLVRRFGQPRTVKAAMHIRGYAGGGYVRLPYNELDADQRRELEVSLGACDEALATIPKAAFAGSFA